MYHESYTNYFSTNKNKLKVNTDTVRTAESNNNVLDRYYFNNKYRIQHSWQFFDIIFMKIYALCRLISCWTHYLDNNKNKQIQRGYSFHVFQRNIFISCPKSFTENTVILWNLISWSNWTYFQIFSSNISLILIRQNTPAYAKTRCIT